MRERAAVDDAGTELRWTVEPGDTVTVVHVLGDIDLSTEHEFAKAVRDGLDRPSPVVVFDLAGIAFMGSVGLRVLIDAHHEAHEAGRVVRIVDGSAFVRRIMEVTGLGEVLSVHHTLDEARSA
ncbi:anti-anti-sigma factor [Kibdelosporangium banguiense]|uniref:Anti-sigma factor antagonist n=1 Tax=Kibdelosporangium banguiense TaxID=1365924 RepID=A0ABS4T7U2_9PSEU|nr:STAS domain-containing protein [Kibdelosporangium banguiense]MBP2320491.1 anti-anti-sigma factor [Kibdelosporangium banguiense]